MRRRSLAAALAAVCLILAIAATSPTDVGAAAPGDANPESDLLDKPRHGEDAIRALGSNASAAAARNGQTLDEFKAKLRTDSSYFVDKKGRFVVHDTGLLAGGSGSSDTVASAGAPFPYAETFQLHSRPGANRVIYLDFDGHSVSGTGWNASYTGGAAFTAVAYDTDGLATFSDAEQDVVQSVWQRVSEDYSAFDVDVTTQDPGADAITRSGSGDLVYGTRAVITNTTTVYSSCGCGGIAYVGTYDITSNHTYYQPALVFQRGVGSGAHNIAEATSHEVGHNLGLSHDGTATTGYYVGHGEWAPIMGVGYYEPVTQWSKGEYTGANNTEDDWVVMQSNGAPLRPDDHGGSAAEATALTGPVLSAVGRINSRTDTDWFSFTTQAGDVSLAVAPAPVSPDLDASLTVFDAGGTQVGFADPTATQVTGDVASGLDASLTLTLAAGTYSVKIDGVGKGTPFTGYSDYASVGTFTFTGTLPSGAPSNVAPTAAASATPTSGVAPVVVDFSSAGSSDADGVIISRSWDFGDGSPASSADTSHTYTTAGTFTATLTVTDDDGATDTDTTTVVVSPPAPSAPNAPSDVTATVGSGRSVIVHWTDNSSNETSFTVLREKRNKNGTWGSATVVATTAANATTVTNSSGKGTFRYSVRADNAGGSSIYVVSNTVTV
ncbi:MAG: PKD domain-containing protein [Acidimicrobiales bacterium]